MTNEEAERDANDAAPMDGTASESEASPEPQPEQDSALKWMWQHFGQAAFDFWSWLQLRPKRIGEIWVNTAISATGINRANFEKEHRRKDGEDDNEPDKVDGSIEELKRFTFLGSVVIITAAWATFGAFFFFSEVFRSQMNFALLIVTCLFAVLWGLMIFNIDRVFLSSMLGLKGVNRFSAGIFRLIMAAILGYVISHPLKIMFFHDTIEQYDKQLYLSTVERLKEEHEVKYRDVVQAIQSTDQKLRNLNADKITRDLQLALDQIKKAQDLVEREENEKGRRRIVGRYAESDGKISNVVLPKPDASLAPFPAYNVRVIGTWGCLEDDRLYREYIDNWAGSFPDIDFLTKLNKAYVQYNATEENNGISNCSLGRILETLWKTRYDELVAKNPDQQIALVASSRSQLELEKSELQADLDQLITDGKAIPETARVLVGQGYAHRTSVLADLSDPSLIDEAVKEDPKLKELTFYRPQYRSYNFWIGWAIAVIFIFVESAPVIAKMFMRSGPYESRLAERQANREDSSSANAQRERTYEEDFNETYFAHRNAARTQALAFRVSAEREVATGAARILSGDEPTETKQSELKKMNQLLAAVIDLFSKMGSTVSSKEDEEDENEEDEDLTGGR